MRGTHKGEFIGITPTNKALEMTVVNKIASLEDMGAPDEIVDAEEILLYE